MTVAKDIYVTNDVEYGLNSNALHTASTQLKLAVDQIAEVRQLLTKVADNGKKEFSCGTETIMQKLDALERNTSILRQRLNQCQKYVTDSANRFEEIDHAFQSAQDYSGLVTGLTKKMGEDGKRLGSLMELGGILSDGSVTLRDAVDLTGTTLPYLVPSWLKKSDVVGGAVSLLGNAADNMDEYERGDISKGRAVAETVLETVVDIGKDKAVEYAVTVGAFCVLSSPVAIVTTVTLGPVVVNDAIDRVSEFASEDGKDFSESISDALLDLTGI